MNGCDTDKAMLIKTKEELRQVLPTSVVKTITELTGLMDRAEDAHLRPVLGSALYARVLSDYETATAENSATEITPLVKLCQSAAVHFALADNIGILAVSFNTGSGFATVTTDGYTPADEKDKAALAKDLWRNASRDIDRILQLLETDATSGEPQYADLWKESPYFYEQGDLLISTAREASRYVKADEQPYDRTAFVKQQGDMRYCQMANISMAIGEEWLQWLVEYPRMKEEVVQESGATPKCIESALQYLRQALTCYARHRRTRKKDDEDEARLSLFRATEYMQKHQEEMGTAFSSSPLYEHGSEEEPTTNAGKCHRYGGKYDGSNACDKIFSPFSL